MTAAISRRSFGAALAAVALALGLIVKDAAALRITDIAGRTVEVKQPIERLILGEGRMLYAFAELGHNATGVDFAGAMLQQARDKAAARRSSARFFEGYAEAPPSHLGPVDLICMRHVI